MSQDVAVVDIPRELSQLIVRDIEVCAILCILLRELGFGPSDAIMKGFEWLHEGSVFPALIERLARGMAFVLDVNERLSVAIFLI
jgi:hypothetical protein